jgi:hypothetical protein
MPSPADRLLAERGDGHHRGGRRSVLLSKMRSTPSDVIVQVFAVHPVGVRT